MAAGLACVKDKGMYTAHWCGPVVVPATVRLFGSRKLEAA